MNYPIIDTHTHLYFPACNQIIEQIRNNSKSAGVTHQIQIGCDEISSLAALNLAKKYPEFLATIGLHPCDVQNIGIKNPEYHRYKNLENYDLKAKNIEELFNFFDNLVSDNLEYIVGFGETGFDLYHQNSPELLKLQTIVFKKHLDLSRKFKKPFILHSRGAKKETLDFLGEHLNSPENKNIKGVWHCFSEDLDTAKIATHEFGLYLGVGGVLTYNNTQEIRQAIKATPIEFLVTETDAPFLVPKKKKNKKIRINSAEYIPEIIELIAELKEMNIQDCAYIMHENAKQLFNLN
jgi:TatD DNase family protein